MKKLLTVLAAAAMTAVMAGAASAANHFPPGPLGTCTDTMSILTLKTYLNTTITPCNATTPNTTGGVGDTVLGVGGIIIGFDEIATGYDIYLQMAVGGQNTAVDCFTHGTNMRPVYGLNIGDSLVVEYACVANYYGDVEVEAPNNNFSNPNIVLRKVSSGNTLPPALQGNTTDFKETPTNTLMANNMSGLLLLNGPVRVARTLGLATHGMLVVRDAAPSDSVFIDYNKLTTIVPPPVGTYLTSIEGICNSAARGFRIMPRFAADIIDVQPPQVSDGWTWVNDHTYRIAFDRDVTSASATDITNYSLASFGTVNSATMDGTAAVLLDVTTGLPHGASETVTVNGVVGSANGVAMTTPGSTTFLAGILSTGEMSAPDPDSLAATPCQDKSNYAGPLGDYTNGQFGPRSTVTGIVTGIYGNLYYMQDANSLDPNQQNGKHRGITVFAPPTALVLGHQYQIAGADEEYYKENEFAAIQKVMDVGTPGAQIPIPLTVAIASFDTCDANQNLLDGKDYLSLLVTLRRVTVVQRYPTLPTNGFHVAGPYPANTDTIFIENQNAVLGTNSSSNPNYPALGSLIDVVGCEHYTTNTSSPSCRVCPRSPSDITILSPPTGVGAGSPLTLSFSVYPNPARTVNVAFTLPTSSHVTLGVYDLLGRQVAHLASGSFSAGVHQMGWSGLNDNGTRVHSGVYFYKLQVGNEVRTARTLLLND